MTDNTICRRSWSFWPYGGIFVAETLMPAITQLNEAYQHYLKDPEFIAELDADLKHYVGRPSLCIMPSAGVANLAAHKSISNAKTSIIPALTRLTIPWVRHCCQAHGKTRIIAETGAGQHGVATATVAARLVWNAWFTWIRGCRRQALNVYRMKLLGARVVAVESGSKTLKMR